MQKKALNLVLIMWQKVKALLGAITPTNTLNGNRQTQSQRPLPPASSAIRSSPPPAKRPKIRDGVPPSAHTQATFAVASVDGPDETVDLTSPLSRKRRRSSVSNVSGSQPTLNTQASQAKGPRAVVRELRDVDQRLGQQRKRTRRRGSDRINASRNSIDGHALLEPLGSEDGTADEPVDLVRSDDRSTTSQRLGTRSEPKHDLDHFSQRFKRPPRTPTQEFGEVIERTQASTLAKKRKPDSPDELAPTDQEMTKRRRIPGRLQPSPSVSRKGDIRPTKFSGSSKAHPATAKAPAEVEKAREIIGNGLKITRGASGNHGYLASDVPKAEQCYLSTREISTVLHPSTSSGVELQQYAYLTINLSKVKRIVRQIGDDTGVIISYSSADISHSVGSQTFLEFSTVDERQRFLEWVAFRRPDAEVRVEFKNGDGDKIRTTLQEAMQHASRGSKVIMDDMQRPAKGDDIRLIEHNQLTRPRPPMRTNGQLDTRGKLKDSMSQIPTHDSIDKQPPVDDESSPRHFERKPVRTTRATFTLRDSPEEATPEPEGWTKFNTGWQNNWRNSLVFPAQGKSRATVDKEDIPRLDEGQFLNDNIIIFYLRYLQDALETKRPDLAKRIHFHNTFFYTKLKSGKTGQTFNYDSVKTWTSKVDLFAKDFIIVPINEYAHWYVAIIYNAPKLLQSPTGAEQAIGTSEIQDQIDHVEPVQELPPSSSPPTSSERIAAAAQEDLIEHLSRMSLNNHEPVALETKQPTDKKQLIGSDIQDSGQHDSEIHLIKDSDDSRTDVQQMQLPASPVRKRGGKKHSTGPRKYDPDQPRIITLDSLGGPHSPTCSILKQYLVAELKDKKGIKIEQPGALGMTAKGIPEQTNHCDCGLFLLGYIQELLKDPDRFVRSLLQHDDEIAWDFDPSKLRNEIRERIFELQKQQQQREDILREQKKAARAVKNRAADQTETPPQSVTPAQSVDNERTTTEHVSAMQTIEEKDNGTMSSSIQTPSTRVFRDDALPTVENEQSSEEGQSCVKTKQASSGSPETNDPQIVSRRRTPMASTEVGSGQKRAGSNAAKDEATTPALGPSPELGAQDRTPARLSSSPLRISESPRKGTIFAGSDKGQDIQERFLPSLKSSPAGTPCDPVLVEDSQGGEHKMNPEINKQSQRDNRPKQVVEVRFPSRKNQTIYPPEPVVHQKAGEASPYFDNRQNPSRARTSEAKLRDEPMANTVVDISD
ncbi:hypothetical protein F5Y15DRAFT_373496 [Xylariaceae sp. FL0016]|nr:hypothetical protein F5Y15DRAFT_373496 [Xylariaceae sp. FL0016]